MVEALGISSFWVAVGLFATAYLIVMTEQINRAIIALLFAGLLIMSGVLSQHEAIAAIDFNTLGLLAGMMVIVHVTTKTGVFEYIAVRAAQMVKGKPWPLLLAMCTVTAVCSAFLDNVTTVLLVTPVILSLTKTLELDPYPYLFTAIFSSNIGGTATLIGDPPNIMIGSATHLTFNDFLINLAEPVTVIFIATMLPIYFIWGRKLKAHPEHVGKIMALHPADSIKDRGLLKHCLAVITLVLGGFVAGHSLHFEPATIAMTGAALLLLLENLSQPREHHHNNVHAAFAEAEWVTLFFFVGLFILVAGIEKVGFIHMISEQMLEFTDNDFNMTALTILWGSAVFSSIVDNIPFVATMIPTIKAMAPVFGEGHALDPLWWSLALGACLGGNGSLIGASANLVVAGIAEKNGVQIRFVPFLLRAFPLMIFSIVICHVYIEWRFLP